MSINKAIDCLGLLFIFPIFYGCAQNVGSDIDIFPKHFKIQIPFEVKGGGINITTYWGKDKIKHTLLLDNHSPTWANDKVLKNNASISKSNDFLYRTTTADGTSIQGRVYISDSVLLGDVTFKNVPFYIISNKGTNRNNFIDGVFGENMMSKGIWKIDFKNRILIFASSIDSLTGIDSAKILPANFSDKGIEIKATFSNQDLKVIQLDLGYNLSILIPPKEFAQIVKGNKKIYSATHQFTTPGNSQSTKTTHAIDSIRIAEDYYKATISSNDLARESLLGYAFLLQFEFIIIDYINKSLYVSKARVY